MATAILSIACHDAGLDGVSIALLWIAVLAFATVLASDLALVRHPGPLFADAGRLGRGFHGLGFVADTCVLGTRIVTAGRVGRAAGTALLACGAVVWCTIGAAVALRHEDAEVQGADGEWLLTVVATEGLAILAALVGTLEHSAALRAIAVALWALGGVLYLIVGEVLAMRLSRRPLSPIDFTPDWWIVMGGAAIFTLGAAVAGHAHRGSVAGVLGSAGWGLATAWIPVLAAAEVWRARRLGRPRFTPERWTMVFPLGMYSACSQELGRALGAGWMIDIGRWWLAVALAAWLAVAVGELRAGFSASTG